MCDRSSRPRHSPTRMSARVERQVVAARSSAPGARTGWARSWVSRRAPSGGSCVAPAMPYLRDCDPMTGVVIKGIEGHRGALREATPRRGGPCRCQEIGSHPRRRRVAGARSQRRGPRPWNRIGYDYVHSMVDDHTSAGLLGDPLRREGLDMCRVHRSGSRILSISGDFEYRTSHHRQSFQRPAAPLTSLRSSASCTPNTSSSSLTAHGRTARWSATTAPCRPNGPIGRYLPPTQTAPEPLHPGSSSTTLDAATAH